MTSIYNPSWNETSFLAKLQLFFKSRKQEKENIQSNDPQVRAGGYSALSITYYGLTDTAFSQLKVALRPKLLAPVKVAAWCLTWLPLAAYCYWRTLPLSDRIVELIGYDNMSVDQCNGRQNILRRRSRYDEARKCIQAAFAKNPEKAHVRGWLHVGRARIYWYEQQPYAYVGSEVQMALAEAEKAEKQDPRQAARIYRHCADIAHLIKHNDPLSDQLRRKAQELEQATGAGDRLLKL